MTYEVCTEQLMKYHKMANCPLGEYSVSQPPSVLKIFRRAGFRFYVELNWVKYSGGRDDYETYDYCLKGLSAIDDFISSDCLKIVVRNATGSWSYHQAYGSSFDGELSGSFEIVLDDDVGSAKTRTMLRGTPYRKWNSKQLPLACRLLEHTLPQCRGSSHRQHSMIAELLASQRYRFKDFYHWKKFADREKSSIAIPSIPHVISHFENRFLDEVNRFVERSGGRRSENEEGEEEMVVGLIERNPCSSCWIWNGMTNSDVVCRLAALDGTSLSVVKTSEVPWQMAYGRRNCVRLSDPSLGSVLVGHSWMRGMDLQMWFMAEETGNVFHRFQMSETLGTTDFFPGPPIEENEHLMIATGNSNMDLYRIRLDSSKTVVVPAGSIVDSSSDRWYHACVLTESVKGTASNSDVLLASFRRPRKGHIQAWDLSTSEKIRRFDHTDVHVISPTPILGQKTFASVSYDCAQFWDARTGSSSFRIPASRGRAQFHSAMYVNDFAIVLCGETFNSAWDMRNLSNSPVARVSLPSVSRGPEAIARVDAGSSGDVRDWRFVSHGIDALFSWSLKKVSAVRQLFCSETRLLWIHQGL